MRFSENIAKLFKANQFILKAEGMSMLPILKPGDVLFLRRIKFRQAKINDLIMLMKGGKVITHRVIYKNTDHLITKGDNNQKSDGKVYPHQIIGKVYQVKRNGYYFNPEDINLLQSSHYYQEITKIKNIFSSKKIIFVILKGLPLHLYFEKKHPSRIYADCDLLIDRNSTEKVERVFKVLNYTKAKSEFSSIHKLLKDKPTEFSFYKKVNDFPVVFDIHLEPVFLMNQLGKLDELYPQGMIDEMTGEILTTKKAIIVESEKFSILNSQFLILYLCLHFFHHNFRGVHRLEFLDKVIRKTGLGSDLKDAQGLTLLIRHYRVENFVYPVFLMLIKYFDTPLPRGFLSSIKPKGDKLKYTKKNIMKINVFDDETRIQAGINRFKNIFFLSPEPIYNKVFVFINPAVTYSIFWVVYKKIRSYFAVTFAPSSLARARK